jgi:hypothetical protein
MENVSLTKSQKERLIEVLVMERCPLDRRRIELLLVFFDGAISDFITALKISRPPATKVREIKSVLKAARKLKETILELSPITRVDLGDSAQQFFEENYDDKEDSSRKNKITHWEGFDEEIDTVIDVCAEAVDEVRLFRQLKPSIIYMEMFVRSIAVGFYNILHKLPPYSKNCWFYVFVNELLAMVSPGMKCGEDLLKKVMTRLRKDIAFLQKKDMPSP